MLDVCSQATLDRRRDAVVLLDCTSAPHRLEERIVIIDHMTCIRT